MTAEEAICILVSSYKSSERNQDVYDEVAVLSKKVLMHCGLITRSLLAIRLISPTLRLKPTN
jgi:hypothetical protein